MPSARSFSVLLTLAVLAVGASHGDCSSAGGGQSFTVLVAGKPALVLSEEELLKMPQHTAKVKEHESEATYSGASLHDVLVRAGAPSGNQLHGRAISSYVLASATDGYQAVFTLTEMDPGFTDDQVLVADRVNGQALPETQGPFRIIAVHDKKPARSVRMLEKIEVVQLRH